MKKIKLLLLMSLIVMTCTGCTIEYNINITKDKIEEVINVKDYISETRTSQDIMNHYNTWYPTFVNYIPKGQETIELEDYNEKVEGIEYHDKTINEINNGYQYTYKYIYPIEKYYDSYVLASSFIETTVHKGYNNLVIKTGKENLLCQYDYFDSVKVNITIDPEVYKLNYTNTSNIKNNTYIWNLDRSNCKNSQIILTLDEITDNHEPIDNKEPKNKNSEYTMYIFFGILLLIILIGYIIFKKMKQKSENFDMDD